MILGSSGAEMDFAETPFPQAEIVVRSATIAQLSLPTATDVPLCNPRAPQHHRANEIETDAALHTRENASSFFNEA